MKTLAFIGLLAILGIIGAGVYFFGGYYDVAGSLDDPAVVDWSLKRIRLSSVQRHAVETSPATLGDPAIVRAGARAFSVRGCPTCHGAPGVAWAKFAEGLRPDPPDLKDLAKERASPQLFWVIKNGIKMTGMPSFGAIGVPDDEIWSIVAFVKKLPEVSDADYKSWSAPPVITPVR
jgi:Cytochrome C oxidase, cbb3-type, subunit III